MLLNILSEKDYLKIVCWTFWDKLDFSKLAERPYGVLKLSFIEDSLPSMFRKIVSSPFSLKSMLTAIGLQLVARKTLQFAQAKVLEYRL